MAASLGRSIDGSRDGAGGAVGRKTSTTEVLRPRRNTKQKHTCVQFLTERKKLQATNSNIKTT